MPCWYYEKKELRNTPSIQDGIDYETECRYRREGARLIIDTGTKMDLGYNTVATGVVYFHRFYMYHSFRQFPRYVTACCCLFLAGKVEETPKKCRDIIRIARSFLTDQKFMTFGEDPKEEVMTLERILLQTIQFDLQVEHPYCYLKKYIKCLKGDKGKLQKMVQMAWTFVNDSLCTTLCLQWEPEIIAVALMHLASKLSQFEVVDWAGRTSKHLRWWDMYVKDITMELLEDICHQVLDLYSQPQSSTVPDSPPLTAPASVTPIKKDRAAIPPVTSNLPVSPAATAIPVKVSTKTENRSHNGESRLDKDTTRSTDLTNPYSYPSYTHSAVPPTFPSGFSSAIPPPTTTPTIAPPVAPVAAASSTTPTPAATYPSYPPSHQYPSSSSSTSSSTFYQNVPSTSNRPFYPPAASSGPTW